MITDGSVERALRVEASLPGVDSLLPNGRRQDGLRMNYHRLDRIVINKQILQGLCFHWHRHTEVECVVDGKVDPQGVYELLQIVQM